MPYAPNMRSAFPTCSSYIIFHSTISRLTSPLQSLLHTKESLAESCSSFRPICSKFLGSK